MSALWLVLAVALVTSAVEVVKRTMMPKDVPPAVVRILVFVAAFGTTLLPIAPTGSPVYEVALAVVTAAGSILTWHGLRDQGLLRGTTQRDIEQQAKDER